MQFNQELLERLGIPGHLQDANCNILVSRLHFSSIWLAQVNLNFWALSLGQLVLQSDCMFDLDPAWMLRLKAHSLELNTVQ